MDLEQIQQLLHNRFYDINNTLRKIVFWYDSESHFTDLINGLTITNVKIHQLTGANYFATKRLLEQDDTESNYLIYAPFHRPNYEDDWLLDIFLYSEEFSADKASVIMSDLGIMDISLKDFMGRHLSFFDDQERYRRLEAIPHNQWDETTLELGMMAVICKQKTAVIEEIVKALFIAGLDETENEPWRQIAKWPGYERFWHYVRLEYGYISDASSLKKFLISLMLTSLEHDLKTVLPGHWNSYRVSRKANGVVFIDHWMNSREESAAYDKLAEMNENELNLRGLAGDWEMNDCFECDTFPIFDQTIVLSILNSIQTGSQEYDRFLEMIAVRKTKHWYQRYRNIYSAVTAALELLRFKQQHHGFPIKSAYATFKAYVDDYYHADQAYRCFYEAFDQINDQEILKKIQPIMENLYTNGYLQPLTSVWSELITQEMLEHWPISGIPQQKDFYNEYIRPVLRGDREKIYVIISDALRYEAAEELETRLNQETKGTAKLIALQGIIPSYTKLGMAGLLPGNGITITNQGQILVDGKETENLIQRQKILQDAFPESVAIGLQDLLSMPREEGRELARSNRLFYIYHNIIDATGDKQASEHRVFDAVQRTLADLERGIKYIVNQLSGTNILITADHGFLYQRQALEETDKVGKEDAVIIDGNRRFMLTSEPVENSGMLMIDLNYILGSDTTLKAVVPKGIHRFKTQGGGTAYVHGGASLQEVVVPLIVYKNLKAGKGKEIIQKVDVKLTNTVRKITNNNFTLNFFQTERVSDKRLPRRLRIVMMDLENDGRKISEEKILIADKGSEKADERVFQLQLILKGGQYDRHKDYYLCLYDLDDELNPEYEKIPYTINLGIANDFDDFR
jgi:uncharacterized protein (TIGR02687 family)